MRGGPGPATPARRARVRADGRPGASFIAIVAESYAGKWPFWLSPRQAIVLPVSGKVEAYANKVRQQVYDAGFTVDLEADESLTLNKKIRNAQLAQYNYILGSSVAQQVSPRPAPSRAALLTLSLARFRCRQCGVRTQWSDPRRRRTAR